jgi:hypothetical protein
MIDLITLHAHHKQCKFCGRFDNYIIVKKYVYDYTIIITKCPYCKHNKIIQCLREETINNALSDHYTPC